MPYLNKKPPPPPPIIIKLLEMSDKPQPHTIVHKIGKKNNNKVISEIKLVDVFEKHAHKIVTFG